jgi:hypothetical protein
MTATASSPAFDVANFVPACLRNLADHQKDLPRIAKDPELATAIEAMQNVINCFAVSWCLNVSTKHRVSSCLIGKVAWKANIRSQPPIFDSATSLLL